MILAAHQPNYLPNLAFFNKMKLADVFVIITNIQFEKHEGWQQRHKIPGLAKDLWLTVPALGSQMQLIKDVKINNTIEWRKKHFRTIELFYQKKSGKDHLSIFEAIYKKEWLRLADINIATILAMKESLGIKTPVIIDEDVTGIKHTLLINILKKYKATTFLSGIGAKAYLTDDRLMDIQNEGYSHMFVKKNLSREYPYSTAHYILENGAEWVKEKIS